jgi:5'-deoxynucleotidase YfbR-like HD superfamily hydrolase
MKTWKASKALGETKRFSGKNTANPDNVAAHSFRVALLVAQICEEFTMPGANAELAMKMALLHDFEESIFGDIPAPGKKYLKSIYEDAARLAIKETEILPNYLSSIYNIKKDDSIEAEMVFFADKLDLLLICAMEMERGNMEVYSAYNEMFSIFWENREKIRAFYPFISRILGEVNEYSWKSEFFREELSSEDMGEPKTF